MRGPTIRTAVGLLALLSACAAPGDDDDVWVRPDDAGFDVDVPDTVEAGDLGDAADDGGEACAPECALGTTECLPPPAVDTTFRVCITGSDGCTEWGPPTACPAGQFCQDGSCVTSCTDVCTEGARRCASGEESRYQVCERGARGCLDWGALVDCPASEVCIGVGTCAACASDCDIEGLVRCTTRNEYNTCERTAGGCLQWTPTTACAGTLVCHEGECVDRCVDVCTTGDMQCYDEYYQICMRQPAGCLGWTVPRLCPSGRACVGDGICPTCTDSCTEGEGRCETTTTYRRCELDPGAGCYIWGGVGTCGLHEECQGAGACVVLCTDDCPADGARECGPGGGVRECGVGTLGCLEWSAETACAAVANGTNVCLDGACDLTCEGGFFECGATSCRTSCSPWSQQSPSPAYEEMRGIDFLGTTLWLAGNAGVVAKSTDGGVTWANAGVVPGGTALNGIDFATATAGWAVGNGGAIFQSTDGGRNWTAQTSGVTDALRGVSFVDGLHGWVVGDAGVILATSDGGAVWTRQTSGLTTALFGVHFISATTGWAVGAGGRILKTANGGSVWLPQTTGSTYDIRSVHFVDSDVGWAAGYYYLYRTTNGGTSWGVFTRSAVQYNAIWPLSANAATVVGAAGRVETTTDGGLGWSVRTSGTTANLNGLVFLDALNAVTTGQNGVVLTSSNGGSTWIERRGGTVDNLRSVFFADASHGWAAGAAGRIVATADGGATWTPQTSRTTANLWSVHFPDASHGWAVGDAGTVVATADGGATWNTQTSTSTGVLYDVHFIDATEGWAVGAYSGTSSVRYTPDGGTTWMAEPTGVPASTVMYGVWFNPSGNGWMVGASGTVRYTLNRGVEWRTPSTTGTTQTLWAVTFVSETAGFAVGAAGTLIVTTDGGVTWTLRGTPVTAVLYSLDFVDARTGFASGAAGAFIKTTDGGASWTSRPAPTSRDLRGLSFVDADQGWVSGDFGTILMTRSAGE